jgi:hypothetical protein
MISAQWSFYFSPSILVGFKSRVAWKRRKRNRRSFESKLKAIGATSGETLAITVSFTALLLETHS